MLAVTPTIDITAAATQSVLQAHVTADQATPLRWRFVVVSGKPNNHSEIAQGGMTDGRNPGALSTVRVNSAGEAVLEVYRDNRLIAQARRPFGPPQR
jgi:hypothetical protein